MGDPNIFLSETYRASKQKQSSISVEDFHSVTQKLHLMVDGEPCTQWTEN